MEGSSVERKESIFETLETLIGMLDSDKYLESFDFICSNIFKESEELERFRKVIREEERTNFEIISSILRMSGRKNIFSSAKEGERKLFGTLSDRDKLWFLMGSDNGHVAKQAAMKNLDVLHDLTKKYPNIGRRKIFQMFLFGHFFGINTLSKENFTREGIGIVMSRYERKFAFGLKFEDNFPSLSHPFITYRMCCSRSVVKFFNVVSEGIIELYTLETTSANESEYRQEYKLNPNDREMYYFMTSHFYDYHGIAVPNPYYVKEVYQLSDSNYYYNGNKKSEFNDNNNNNNNNNKKKKKKKKEKKFPTNFFGEIFPPSVLSFCIHYCILIPKFENRDDYRNEGANSDILSEMIRSNDRKMIRYFLAKFPEVICEEVRGYTAKDRYSPPIFTAVGVKNPVEMLDFLIHQLGPPSQDLIIPALPTLSHHTYSRGNNHTIPLIVKIYDQFRTGLNKPPPHGNQKEIKGHNAIQTEIFKRMMRFRGESFLQRGERNKMMKEVLLLLGKYLDWNAMETQSIEHSGFLEIHFIEKVISDDNLEIAKFVIEELPSSHFKEGPLDYFNLRNEHKFISSSSRFIRSDIMYYNYSEEKAITTFISDEVERDMELTSYNTSRKREEYLTSYGSFSFIPKITDIRNNATYDYIQSKRNLWNPKANFQFFSREYKYVVRLFIWILEQKEWRLPQEMICCIFQFVDFFDFKYILGDWRKMYMGCCKEEEEEDQEKDLSECVDIYVWRHPSPDFRTTNLKLYYHEIQTIKKYARDTFYKYRRLMGELEFKSWVQYGIRNRKSSYKYISKFDDDTEEKENAWKNFPQTFDDFAREEHIHLILFVSDLKQEMYFRRNDHKKMVARCLKMIELGLVHVVKNIKSVEKDHSGSYTGFTGHHRKDINWMSSIHPTKYYFLPEEENLGEARRSLEQCVSSFLSLVRLLM